MATVANDSPLAQDHQINVGDSLFPVSWTNALTNASTVAGKALTVLETIAGAARADNYSAKVAFVRVAYTVNSGTPAPKDMTLYLISKASIPATAPVANTSQALVDADADYILGVVKFVDTDFVITDKVAVAQKEVNIPIQSDDSPGQNIYAFWMNGATTWTPAASSNLKTKLWLRLN